MIVVRRKTEQAPGLHGDYDAIICGKKCVCVCVQGMYVSVHVGVPECACVCVIVHVCLSHACACVCFFKHRVQSGIIMILIIVN